MPIQLLEPAGLFRSEHYAQVAIATGTRTVYLAGQVAYDEQQRVVGGDDLGEEPVRCAAGGAHAGGELHERGTRPQR